MIKQNRVAFSNGDALRTQDKLKHIELLQIGQYVKLSHIKVKKRFVGHVNSARNPLEKQKKCQCMFSKKKKKTFKTHILGLFQLYPNGYLVSILSTQQKMKQEQYYQFQCWMIQTLQQERYPNSQQSIALQSSMVG